MEMLLRTIFLFLNYLKYRLKYKDNIWFRGFAVIYAEKGSSIDSITVGDHTDIGSGCKIIDNDFHPLSYSQRSPVERLDLVKHRPITIGEGCFIGANSIILKGTTLGKNVVVGAGSVVCGSFPNNVIIAGNPARIIKENEQ